MLLNFVYNVLETVYSNPTTTYIRRRCLQLPLIRLIYSTTQLYKTRTKAGVRNLRDLLLRSILVAIVAGLLVWLAIFMYIAFYYAYVPDILHQRPVHLQFQACSGLNSCTPRAKGVCSFPAAHLQLTKRQQLLMQGQPYHIHVALEMPESPANRVLGMFMVCADLRSKRGATVAHSCRSAMLHYRSYAMDMAYKLVFGVFFVLGTAEEKQTVPVELFTQYVESEGEPVTDIYIEIQTMHIELYSALFVIHANFTGLRAFMHNWPIISAIIGVISNLLFICMISVFTWRQIVHSEEYSQYLQQAKKISEPKNLDIFKDSDGGSTTPSVADDTSLLDDRDSLIVEDLATVHDEAATIEEFSTESTC